MTGERQEREGPGPDEIAEEIEFYLEMRARELEASGMDPADARQAALDAFGDPRDVEARVRRIGRRTRRRERMGGFVGSVRDDVRHAARTFRGSPGFALAVAGILGLGIGAATAIFSVVNATLLRPLPFPDGDRLVFLQGYAASPEGPRVRGGAFPEVRDWREMSRSFEGVSMVDGVTVTLGGGGEPERLTGEIVEPAYFDLLGARPLAGRTFGPDDDRAPGEGAVAVIGEGLWERRFGRDPAAVGATFLLNDLPFTVVGVLPGGFRGTTLAAEIWVPSMTMFRLGVGTTPEDRGQRWLGAVARLRPGVAIPEAQADMDAVARRLEEAHPEFHRDRGVLVTPAREVYLAGTGPLLLVLLGAAGLLLAITCANVAALIVVRSEGRVREILMRLALGAGRGRIARQLLAESVALACGGAALGVLLAAWGTRTLAAITPPGLLPPFASPTLDGRAFAFAVLVSAAAGLASGLAPALRASGRDLAAGLRGAGGTGGTGVAGGRRPGLLHLFVVAEVALALALLVGAGLMGRSLRAQLAVEPGFDVGRLLAFRLELPEARYARGELPVFVDELSRRLEGLAGVEAVAVATDLPLRGRSMAALLVMEGRDPEDRIRFYRHQVTPGFFRALGIPVLEGRALTEEDGSGRADVLLVSRAFARRFFPEGDAVGRRVQFGGPQGPWFTIVGVAGDVRFRDLTSNIVAAGDDPDVYFAYGRVPDRSVEVAVRTAREPADLVPEVRAAVRDLDPTLPVFQVGPLADGLRRQTAEARFGSLLMGAFSALALVLAAVGVFGVLAFVVGRRTREIAVRMSLGAAAGNVRRMVVGQCMRLAAGGLLAGILLALLGTRALSRFLFGVEATDPATYAAVAALVAAVALAAAAIPAHRATSVDPQEALRGD